MFEDLLNAPPSNPGPPTRCPSRARCENVKVTTADGRVFNLGPPDSRLFVVRTLLYRLKRRLDG